MKPEKLLKYLTAILSKQEFPETWKITKLGLMPKQKKGDSR